MHPTEPNLWLVYVPREMERNFWIARSTKVWGFPETSRKEVTIRTIKRGDVLTFAHSYKPSTPDRPGLGGRRQLEDFLGSIDEVVSFNVHKGYYFSEDPIWDDRKYPHRINLGKQQFCKTYAVVDYFSPELRCFLHRAIYQSPIRLGKEHFLELARYAGRDLK